MSGLVNCPASFSSLLIPGMKTRSGKTKALRYCLADAGTGAGHNAFLTFQNFVDRYGREMGFGQISVTEMLLH